MRPVIDSFQNEDGSHTILSNFYKHPDGLTVEHYYQAMKTTSPAWKAKILSAPTPGKAKRLGQRCPFDPEFDNNKIAVMEALLYVKFRVPAFRDYLLDTGDAVLVEGNTWGDTFWGKCNGEGENYLGRLLMAVRTTLKHNKEN
jgi:ribA/ribD-fused uncharacterized protein